MEYGTAEHARAVLDVLEEHYELHGTQLRWEDPWQLLVAVMLSAQTTDENVNSATPELFKEYPTPEEVADAPLERLEELVYSTGYYKSKAKRLKRMAERVVEEHGGDVPTDMSALVKLPGVGRKTANVVLQVWKGSSEGVVMDTHISRVTSRLGFTEKKDPKKGERVMMELLPKDKWVAWGDLLIQHGRAVCSARKPSCDACPLAELCESAYDFEHFS